MLCNECEKNNATVHITKIVNGNKIETHLCEECAKKQQAFMNSTFSMESLLSGLLSEAFTDDENYADECKTCGMKYEEFKKTGKFGCCDCIITFKDRLMPAIKSIQGYSVHNGKIPKKAGGKYRVRKDIDRLKLELGIRIEQEKYEEAAIIRDKIKELESQIDEA